MGRWPGPRCLWLLIIPYARQTLEFCTDRLIVADMPTILSAIVSLVSFRFRRRASLELEVLALRRQVAVLHRQRPGRAWLRRGDRLPSWRCGQVERSRSSELNPGPVCGELLIFPESTIRHTHAARSERFPLAPVFR